MRRVGTVVRTAGGMAVVRSNADTVPDVGTTVIDDALESVGHVVDVIGPTDRPYLVIAPDGDEPAALLNERLYVR